MTPCAFESPVRHHLAKTIPSHCCVMENSEGVSKWLMLGVAGVGKIGNPLKNWLDSGAEVCCRLKGF